MRTPLSSEFMYTPPGEIGEWWNNHVLYSKFNRQGIDIVCASFGQSEKLALANVVIVTGWSETFLKYAELVKKLHDCGFAVHTYDHQSQGLSGRWLAETQSTWVHSFEDYVDDFVFFVTSVSRENPMYPLYLIAHSMGGLISSIAMSRHPSLVTRACLIAPMLRNKCGMKMVNYLFPFPQQIVYWMTYCACYAALGSVHALGFFKESAQDMLQLNVTTSDPKQLDQWQQLRKMYPQIMSTCVTNDWVLHSIRAQKRFSFRYELVQTNTIILAAEHDRFVHNRAMKMFVQRAPCSKLLIAPGSFHEILNENKNIRGAAVKIITDFFMQISDDATFVNPVSPFLAHNKTLPIYSVPESLIQVTGLMVSAAGAIIGLAMMFSGSRHRQRIG